MFQLIYCSFRIHRKSYRPVELKRITEGEYQKNVGFYEICLTMSDQEILSVETV